MRDYVVVAMEDSEMPEGKDWLMIKHRKGVVLAIRRSCEPVAVLADAWAATRLLQRDDDQARRMPA